MPRGRSRWRLPQSRDRGLQGSTHCGYCVHGSHLLPMDHDRRNANTPATRCTIGIMPVAASLSSAPPTATPLPVMGHQSITLPEARSHNGAPGTLSRTISPRPPRASRSRVGRVLVVTRTLAALGFSHRCAFLEPLVMIEPGRARLSPKASSALYGETLIPRQVVRRRAMGAFSLEAG